MFHMFKNFPATYESMSPLSESTIDDRQVAILHAPSEMTFEMPRRGATVISGRFGFLPGAYSQGGNTDGAEFIVYWTNGVARTELYRRYLDPVHNRFDRGLQPFEAQLKGLVGGKIYLQIKPGPNNNFSWDWTGWTEIEIK